MARASGQRRKATQLTVAVAKMMITAMAMAGSIRPTGDQPMSGS